MSVAAAALALPRDFDFEGHTYQLRPLTFNDLARFSLWVEERARVAMNRAVEAGDADPRAALAAFLEAVASGTFEPGGDAFVKATRSEYGKRKIVELMLAVDDSARWQALSWEIYADEDAFRRALAVAGEANADPLAARARRLPGPPARPSP